MEGNIYISKRCEYCHELLILLHKNKDIFKYKVIDIDSNPYPSIVQSVPSLVIKNQVLPGAELFKYLNYLINKNKSESTSNNINKNNDDIPRLSEQDLKPVPVDNNSDSNKELDGFCFGGSCNLGFSSINEENIDNNTFEYLNPGEINTTTHDFKMNKTRKEESAELDNQYEKMMEARKLESNNSNGMNQMMR